MVQVNLPLAPDRLFPLYLSIFEQSAPMSMAVNQDAHRALSDVEPQKPVSKAETECCASIPHQAAHFLRKGGRKSRRKEEKKNS